MLLNSDHAASGPVTASVAEIAAISTKNPAQARVRLCV